MTYGYQGLVQHANKLGIDLQDWMAEEITTERGGMAFMTPNVDGAIYLTWGDIYYVDITFVNQGKEFKEKVQVNDLISILGKIEQMRNDFIKGAAASIMEAFKSAEESDGTKF